MSKKIPSKQERNRFYSSKNYYTSIGCDSIPESVLKKWSPALREYAIASMSRMASIKENGVLDSKARYHSQKESNRTVNIEGIRHLQITLIPGKSKNWMVRFTKIGHKSAKTTNTSDEQKAIAFAKKWYKTTIIPTLQNNSGRKVLDFVKQDCTFLGKSKWNHDEYGFLDLPKCPSTHSGVYLILFRNKVQKVGKADGVNGLQARLRSYSSRNKKRVTGEYIDQFTVSLNKKMSSPNLKGKAVSFYYYEVPKESGYEAGYKVDSCKARSLEKEISIQCRLQGHPMTLSASD